MRVRVVIYRTWRAVGLATLVCFAAGAWAGRRVLVAIDQAVRLPQR